MPIKIKDAEGNEHEIQTKEEFDAAVAEGVKNATEDLQKTVTDLSAKFDQKPPENQPPAGDPPKNDPPKNEDEPPAWAKALQEQVNLLSNNQSHSVLGRFTGSVSEDQRKEIQEKYNAMTGYENTPEGLEARASDAYTLVVGRRPEESGVNLGNVNAAGGAPAGGGDGGYQPTESDKELQKALGVSEDDVKKYGGEQK